ELLGHRKAVDADLLHLLNPLFGVLVGVLHLLYRRPDLSVDEVTDCLDQEGLFVVQWAHGGSFGLARWTVIQSPRKCICTSIKFDCGSGADRRGLRYRCTRCRFSARYGHVTRKIDRSW